MYSMSDTVKLHTYSLKRKTQQCMSHAHFTLTHKQLGQLLICWYMYYLSDGQMF